MKTKNQLQQTKFYFKTVLIALALIILSKNSSSQNSYFSIGIASDVSGSGLGGNVRPMIFFTNKKQTFSIGPNFQTEKMNFSGAQANYRYAMAKSSNEKLELFFSGNFTFQSSAYMSADVIKIENSCHPEETMHYEDLRLKVIEGYLAVGLKINPTKKINVAFSTGLGAFNTLNKNYCKEMYREKSALVCQFRIALIYNFQKSVEKNNN